MTAAELISFERTVADAFEAKRIAAPIHLSGGNEEQLITIFRRVPKDAWVFSTWRSHYHALLHGVPPEKVMAQIMAGRSMNLSFPERRFFASAIVGGILPIACGVAHAGNEAWCFVGDMCARTGIFHEATQYARGHGLNVHFIIEDNHLSTNSPTAETWGLGINAGHVLRYTYERTYPHTGSGKYVAF